MQPSGFNTFFLHFLFVKHVTFYSHSMHMFNNFSVLHLFSIVLFTLFILTQWKRNYLVNAQGAFLKINFKLERNPKLQFN